MSVEEIIQKLHEVTTDEEIMALWENARTRSFKDAAKVHAAHGIKIRDAIMRTLAMKGVLPKRD